MCCLCLQSANKSDLVQLHAQLSTYWMCGVTNASDTSVDSIATVSFADLNTRPHRQGHSYRASHSRASHFVADGEASAGLSARPATRIRTSYGSDALNDENSCPCSE